MFALSLLFKIIFSHFFFSIHKNQISCDIRTHSLAPVHRYRPSFGCNKFSTRNNASILLNHTPPPLDGLWCGIRFVPFAVTAISSSLSNEIEHETGPRRCAIKLHFVHRSANGIGLRLMFLVLLFFFNDITITIMKIVQQPQLCSSDSIISTNIIEKHKHLTYLS